MDFFKLIQSLEELLYEVLSWLLFYPTTLWRVLAHPVRTLHYAEKELGDERADQFGDAVNPPLFLFLTLILIHLIELLWIGQSKVVEGKAGVNALVTSDTSVIVLRSLIFGLFPLLLARKFLKEKGVVVDRQSLRMPFYAQCYATVPFAMLVSASTLIVRKYSAHGLTASLMCFVAALLWFGIVQVEWFRTRLVVSRWKAFKYSSVVMAQGVLVLIFTGAMLD
jgi:hypothetical protein